MITLYGIPNCDTCRKARKWLDAAGIEHRFHDFRKDGLDAGPVADWSTELGLDKLVNRRGTTWRKLDDDQKARLDTDSTALLLENPTLLKRPVVDLGERRLVGFDAAVISALEAL
jgi:arsenate reductase (glutaredoxin)